MPGSSNAARAASQTRERARDRAQSGGETEEEAIARAQADAVLRSSPQPPTPPGSPRSTSPSSNPTVVSSAPSTPVAAATAPTGDAIIDRFKLGALADPHQTTVKNLVQNGLYYMTVSNSISALASFSSAASYVYALKQGGAPVDTILPNLLGYVEKLQEETKKLGCGGGGGGGAGGGGGGKGDEEDENDWAAQCYGRCEEVAKNMNLTFKDVIGMEKEKETFFGAIVNPIVYPNLYTKAAKGVLLYGPPGTGKTYIVKAAIRELNERYPNVKVLFFPLTGADLKGKYVGETEKKIVQAYTCAARRACQVTDVFQTKDMPKNCSRALEDIEKIKKEYTTFTTGLEQQQWKKIPQAVSVIFIDEFDAVGGDRAKDESGMTANAVNTMLQMMDGLQTFKNVVTVCATNFPWNLDSALLRRFTEQVYCNVPKINDVKGLVKKEMENRRVYVTANKQLYCSTEINKKAYTHSDQLGTAFPEQDKAALKASEKILIAKFDASYMNDGSPAFESIVSEMAEKQYSNSDVSSVMQKAYNIVSESALRSGVWIKFDDTDGPFWISRLTKLADAAGSTGVTTLLKKLEDGAMAKSDYSKNPWVQQVQFDTKAAPENKLEVPEGIFLDKENVKSIFSNIAFDGIEYQVTSIYENNKNVVTGQGQTQRNYVNIRFINDLPSLLMFNDISIADMYYDINEVENLRKLLASTDKVTSYGKPCHSEDSVPRNEFCMSLIFSKVINVEYGGAEKRTDNIELIKQQIGSVLNDIDTYDNAASAAEATKITEEEKTKKSNEFNNRLYDLIKRIAPYLLVDDGVHSASKTRKETDITAENIKALFAKIEGVAKAAQQPKTSQGVLSFFSGGTNTGKITKVHINNDLYNLAGIIEAYTINENVKLELVRKHFETELKNLGTLTATIDEVKANYKDYHDYVINFMSEGEYSELKRYIDDSDPQQLTKHLVKVLDPLNKQEKVSIFETVKQSNKKVFYFKSYIQPLKADWVKSKASGPSILPDAAKRRLEGVWKGIKSGAAYLSGTGKSDAELQTTVAGRIAETGIPLVKYLLLRATHMAVADVASDLEYYRKKTDKGEARLKAQEPKSGGAKTVTRKLKHKRNSTRKVVEYRLTGGVGQPDFAKLVWFQLDLKGSTKVLSLEGGNWGLIIGICAGLSAPLWAPFAAGATLVTMAGIAVVGAVVGAVGGKVAAGVINKIAPFDVNSSADRLIFNSMLGYFYTFKNAEDNVLICNLMFAEVFGAETLDLGRPQPESYSKDWWASNMDNVFQHNYEKALKARERVWTQIREYCKLELKTDIDSQINLKEIEYPVVKDKDGKPIDIDKTKFLSFYMDPSFISAALKSYPSTYNPVTGQQLEDYNRNRAKFLEDYQAGKYDKKKA
jgi:SpoVK/Ycf46/Vps4 family AAA+-type ATPase